MVSKKMLLLTFNEWIGPGRSHSSPWAVQERTRTIAFATRLELAEAISRINDYQIAYNKRFTLAVNFSLVAVAEIDSIPDASLETVNVHFVERLAVDFPQDLVK
jgi:hypothetical protein